MDAVDLFHETSRSISNLLPRLRLHVGEPAASHVFFSCWFQSIGSASANLMVALGISELGRVRAAFETVFPVVYRDGV
jgi:hypothetical protein